MSEVLLAALVVSLLGAVALGLLVAVTVVPFVLALQRADRRGISPNRVGAVALLGCAVGLGATVWLALRTSAPVPVTVLPLLLVAAGPLAAGGVPARLLGRRGAHQPGAV